MSNIINEFKADYVTMYNSRIVDDKLSSKIQNLTVTQRVKAVALEIFAILAVVFSLGNEGWRNVVKELHAQVRTGVAYIPFTPQGDGKQPDAPKSSLVPGKREDGYRPTAGFNIPDDAILFPMPEGGLFFGFEETFESSSTPTTPERPDPVGAASSSAPFTVTPQLVRPNDEQIRKIVAELNSVDRHGAFGITEETIKQFLDRGGHIQVLEDGQQIPLKRGERYIVGCSSGVNRSQTHAAYMIRNGVPVDAILAGGDSGFNPTTDYPTLGSPYTSPEDEAAFRAHFGFGKRPQFGSEFNGGVQLDEANFVMVPGVREHYEGLVNRLEPTHFIAYAMSGPSVLKRLLDSNKPSLAGFTITFVNWADQIVHTPEGVAPCSQEAYRLFEARVADHFPIVD